MRAFRLALAGTAATLAVSAATATAAPPVGCYGLPDYPAAFACIVSFTPTGAVPSAGIGGGYTTTVPRFCAGSCYGPIPVTVPTPYVQPGSGSVAVVTYNGQTYVVAIGGEIPPIPPLPPIGVPPLPEPDTSRCPGDPQEHYTVTRLEPYVCARTTGSTPQSQTFYVGTCATPNCTVVEVPVGEGVETATKIALAVGELVDRLRDMPIGCTIADVC